ncbi:MAG: superoxide dismutase [Opitutus sp.]|nr:superoxide dismutase [Opitutus sp.]
MRYLALERELPTLPRPDYADLLRREAVAVWRLQTDGIVREIWFTHPERHAVVTLECASLASARDHLASLPLVRAGLIEFQLHELRPYDGYERLFAAASADHAAGAPAEY